MKMEKSSRKNRIQTAKRKFGGLRSGLNKAIAPAVQFAGKPWQEKRGTDEREIKAFLDKPAPVLEPGDAQAAP